MSDIQNEPAFPSVCLNDPTHPASVPGMSLRDWLAGQALAGFFASPNDMDCGVADWDAHQADICRNFYGWADAMLAARTVSLWTALTIARALIAEGNEEAVARLVEAAEKLSWAVKAMFADLGRPGSDGWTNGYAHQVDYDAAEDAMIAIDALIATLPAAKEG